MTDTDLPAPDQAPGAPHPRETRQLFGQDQAQADFLSAFTTGRMHHGWLLTGPEGVGKATLADRFGGILKNVGLLPTDTVVKQSGRTMQDRYIGGTQANYYMLHEGQNYWADPWHWATTAIVAACRTHGVLPVDGPFGDFSDDEGFRAQARRSATLGMVGKWAIHPKQVALANEVFTPSEAAVTEAREILAAMEEAKAKGEGATVYKGRLVDIASIKQAEVIVRQSEMIAGA